MKTNENESGNLIVALLKSVARSNKKLLGLAKRQLRASRRKILENIYNFRSILHTFFYPKSWQAKFSYFNLMILPIHPVNL